MTTSVSRDPGGEVYAPRSQIAALPPKGKRAVYICTSAQSNTKVHAEVWRNLMALVAYEKAILLVGSITYSKAQKGGKRKTAREGSEKEEWWDAKVEPHLFDTSATIAPGLVWCGELNILPTASDPISGLESYTGRASSIFPHNKIALTCVASPKNAGTKFCYTTGTVTQRNYIQKKAGQKAAFHHGYGALIVEVDSDGTWFVRQLNADSDGIIYDLDRCVKDGKVTTGHRPEAIVWGDLHERQLESKMRILAWGKDGILDVLQPYRQVFHDLLDFRSQNHHDRDDPWKTFKKYTENGLGVEAEIASALCFLDGEATRDWCESVVVCSNHDMALVRWLKEVDFREDPHNAEFILEATLAAYRAIRTPSPNLMGQPFYPVEWAFEYAASKLGQPAPPVYFLRRDEEYLVCKDHGGGIELGMHGDKGANGAKGSLKGFARTGRKCIIGDRHTPGIFEGAMQVGVMGSLDQGYNEGQSSWSHTNAIVYPNGKRALFTIYNGKWRA